jgi:soluble lytic murein transglycosylase-like protein
MRFSIFIYLAAAALAINAPVVNASFIDHPVHSGKWTNKYDRHFKKYSKRYFGPLFDWHWFKAQAIAESALNNDAKSHVGARGLMQIMPGTFSDITKVNPHFSKLESPKWNIAAGIYYDRTLYRKFKKTAVQDKLYMTFASYNAGYGRILNAAKRTGSEEKNWEEIKPFMPKETRGYVKRIRKLMGEY